MARWNSGRGVAARTAGVMGLIGLAGAAQAQYSQDFEGLSASATGVSLTTPPQDAWYIPPITGSSDTFAYTYAGNALNFAQNPQGGNHFAASNLLTARAQRDMVWPGDVTTVEYDFAAQNNGTQVNNIGSFSAQPHIAPPTHRTFIILANYATVPVPGKYNINYIGFNAANTIDPGVGRLMWADLDVNVWYRLSTTIDWNQNKIIKVGITNLTTGVSAEQDLSGSDLHVGGGATPTIPKPTGLRIFNNQVSNASGYDNLNVSEAGGGCPCACDYDITTGPNLCDIFDFLAFQNGYDAGDPCSCDKDVSTGPAVCDIFDFLAFQNEYDTGCP